MCYVFLSCVVYITYVEEERGGECQRKIVILEIILNIFYEEDLENRNISILLRSMLIRLYYPDVFSIDDLIF